MSRDQNAGRSHNIKVEQLLWKGGRVQILGKNLCNDTGLFNELNGETLRNAIRMAAKYH
jgi:hypothetical protein